MPASEEASGEAPSDEGATDDAPADEGTADDPPADEGAADSPSAGDRTASAAVQGGEAARGRRGRAELDRIFGDVLPDTTRDERGDGGEGRGGDDWYLGNRPPHHGG